MAAITTSLLFVLALLAILPIDSEGSESFHSVSVHAPR
jgi:hypothetical protein